jgi:hypothetical protein
MVYTTSRLGEFSGGEEAEDCGPGSLAGGDGWRLRGVRDAAAGESPCRAVNVRSHGDQRGLMVRAGF